MNLKVLQREDFFIFLAFDVIMQPLTCLLFIAQLFPSLAHCDRCCLIPNKVIHCYILFSKWIETEPKKNEPLLKNKAITGNNMREGILT